LPSGGSVTSPPAGRDRRPTEEEGRAAIEKAKKRSVPTALAEEKAREIVGKHIDLAREKAAEKIAEEES